MTKNHSDRAHALLSASGADRWINCTPSARIEEKLEEPISPYASEGTLAHEFADIGLRLATKQMLKRAYNKAVKTHRVNKLYSPEMEDEVQKYIDYVVDQFKASKRKSKDAILLVEEKIDLTEFIEDGFGTGDAIIICDGVMEVIDLKYGKGIKVDADDNSQLKLYGIGALFAHDLMYDIHTVQLTVVQPRLDHISNWGISAEELYKWGDQVVKPKAAEAYSGKGVQKCGTWCRWCKAKAKCATLAAKNLEMAKHEFKDPHLLTDTQLLEVYGKIPLLQDWAKAVGEHMLSEALKGKQWPGLKLVEGRSVRKWKDEARVKEILEDELFEESKFMSAPKLLGITAIEKLVTKKEFPELLGALVIKPEGKPSLALESDKRPAINTVEKAKEVFKD